MYMENQQIRQQFPILSNNLIYLDSASTSQKPQEVIDSVITHYQTSNANVHRGLYGIAHEADKKWVKAHQTISNYINAKSYKEVFFVKNCTEGLNWIANAITFKQGDVVVISEMEHHSNLLPWLKISKERGIIVETLRTTNIGTIDTSHLQELIDKYGSKIKALSIIHQSNVLGTINPVKELVALARNIGALTIIDAAQSIAHMKIDVAEIGCDVLIFSSHKVYGPSGVGVVYCKEELLNNFEPWIMGGEMVKNVQKDNIVYNDLPWKFEAGTPAIEAGVGFGVAIEWFDKTITELGGWDKYREHEMELTKYLINELTKIPGIEFVGGRDAQRLGIVAFNIAGIHPHDISSMLGEKGICVRAGYHCAQPLHDKYGLKGSVRVSLGIYNTVDDITALLNQLTEIVKVFN